MSEKFVQGRLDSFVQKMDYLAAGNQFQANSLANEAAFMLLLFMPVSISTFGQIL
jgi:hypothetical protein